MLAKATQRDIGWYNKILLPLITPAKSVFDTALLCLLFALIGIAVGHIHRCSESPIRSFALGTWTINMLLNLSSASFFLGLQELHSGLKIYVTMWLSLVGIILPFHRLLATSAYLIVPDTAWLTFATILNWDICRLNPCKRGYSNAKFDVAQLLSIATSSSDPCWTLNFTRSISIARANHRWQTISHIVECKKCIRHRAGLGIHRKYRHQQLSRARFTSIMGTCF